MLLVEFSNDTDPRNHKIAIVLEHVTGVQQFERRKKPEEIQKEQDRIIHKSVNIKSDELEPLIETETILQIHTVGNAYTLYGWDVSAWRRYIEVLAGKMKGSGLILPKS